MLSKPISLGVLLYGDHPQLADRCLRSIWEHLDETGRSGVAELRVGLNEISSQTRRIVDWIAANAPAYGIPLTIYDCPKNALKYPLMRRMWLDPAKPPAEWIMWFDDDSYLVGERSFWYRLHEAMGRGDMVGKVYWQRHLSKQWAWVRRQPWCNPELGPLLDSPIRQFKQRPQFKFCTGGWWVARSEILTKHDWPCRELKLIGGDSMLGELCRHQGYELVNFDYGVRINANEAGKHSSAPGRGASPHPRDRGRQMLGNVEVHDFSHLDFECNITQV